MYAPKDVEVSSSEVYGSVSEKFARKNIAIEKHRGVVTTPLGSSRVKFVFSQFFSTVSYVFGVTALWL